MNPRPHLGASVGTAVASKSDRRTALKPSERYQVRLVIRYGGELLADLIVKLPAEIALNDWLIGGEEP